MAAHALVKFPGPGPHRLGRAGQFTLLASPAILDELDEVLRRPEVLDKLHLTRLEARARLAQPEKP